MGERDGFSQRRLRGAMKLVKEAGLFSNFTSKDIYFKKADGRPRAVCATSSGRKAICRPS